MEVLSGPTFVGTTLNWKVTKRAAPTVSGNSGQNSTVDEISVERARTYRSASVLGYDWTASAEL